MMIPNFWTRVLLVPVIGLFGVLWTSTQCAGSLQMRLDDGVNPVVTVTDLDADGFLNFSGAIPGSIWTVNVSTSRSKPNVGSASRPELRLTTTNMNSVGSGTLTISVSDTDFGPTLNPLPVAIRSSSSDPFTGAVTTKAFIDLANTAFNTVLQIGPTLIGSGVYTLEGSGIRPSDGQFSLNLVTTVTHTGVSTSQFDSALSTLPEPATMAIWSVVG